MPFVAPRSLQNQKFRQIRLFRTTAILGYDQELVSCIWDSSDTTVITWVENERKLYSSMVEQEHSNTHLIIEDEQENFPHKHNEVQIKKKIRSREKMSRHKN